MVTHWLPTGLPLRTTSRFSSFCLSGHLPCVFPAVFKRTCWGACQIDGRGAACIAVQALGMMPWLPPVSAYVRFLPSMSRILHPLIIIQYKETGLNWIVSALPEESCASCLVPPVGTRITSIYRHGISKDRMKISCPINPSRRLLRQSLAFPRLLEDPSSRGKR